MMVSDRVVAREQFIGTVDLRAVRRSRASSSPTTAGRGVMRRRASRQRLVSPTVADNDAPRIWDMATVLPISDPFFDSGGPMAWSPEGTWLLSAGTTASRSTRTPPERSPAEATRASTGADCDRHVIGRRTVVTLATTVHPRWSLNAHDARGWTIGVRCADVFSRRSGTRRPREDDVVRRSRLADGSALAEEAVPEAVAMTPDGRRIAAIDGTDGTLWSTTER